MYAAYPHELSRSIQQSRVRRSLLSLHNADSARVNPLGTQVSEQEVPEQVRTDRGDQSHVAGEQPMHTFGDGATDAAGRNTRTT